MATERTLVVDGSADADETATALESDGWSPVVVESVSGAAARLRSLRFDAVVTEYQLPDGDGFELLERVLSVDETVPVVLYTAHGDEQVAGRAVAAEAAAYVTKDQGATALCERLDAVTTTEHTSAVADVPGVPAGALVRTIESAAVGVTLTDPSLPDTPVVYANAAYQELTGYSEGFILGRDHSYLQGPDTTEGGVAELERAQQQGPITVEMLNYRETGEPFWNQVEATPVTGTDGEPVYIAQFHTDVTERREQESRAKQRIAALRDERESLERVLGRTSELTDDIAEILAGAQSKAEIEQQICSAIVDRDGFTHAVFGEFPSVEHTVTVRASAGAGGTVEAGRAGEAGLSGTLFERARRQGTVEVSSATDQLPPQLAPARFGAGSVAVVPLTYGRTTYGLLAIYTEGPRSLDRRETLVLRAVGRLIASGLNAIEAKQVLRAERVTEVGVDILDEAFAPVELAGHTDGPVEYDTTSRAEDGSLRLFLTLPVSAADAEEAIAAAGSVAAGVVLASQNGATAVSVEPANPTALNELAEYGARTQQITVPSARAPARVVVDAPPEGDVRALVSVLREQYETVELVRQQDRERDPRPAVGVASAVDAELTDRQYTALETAYRNDYFDTPRPVSGKELAQAMDISRQTYHQHLRTAQQKVLDALFEE